MNNSFVKHMGNYLKHLEQLSTSQTLSRKKAYIDYNLKGYFKEIGLSNLKVLEVGPGLGELESYLNEKKVSEIDILDNDKSVLDYVSRKYRIENSFLIKSIYQGSKGLGRYNLIFLMQVLEHFPEDKCALTIKVLYDHLENNGRLVVVVPNGNNPLGLVERYGDFQHTNCFTSSSLKDLVGLAGIKNYLVEIKGYEIPPYGLINLLRVILQKVLHFILLMIMIINGGSFFRPMTPNIMLVIKKMN